MKRIHETTAWILIAQLVLTSSALAGGIEGGPRERHEDTTPRWAILNGVPVIDHRERAKTDGRDNSRVALARARELSTRMAATEARFKAHIRKLPKAERARALYEWKRNLVIFTLNNLDLSNLSPRTREQARSDFDATISEVLRAKPESSLGKMISKATAAGSGLLLSTRLTDPLLAQITPGPSSSVTDLPILNSGVCIIGLIPSAVNDVLQSTGLMMVISSGLMAPGAPPVTFPVRQVMRSPWDKLVQGFDRCINLTDEKMNEMKNGPQMQSPGSDREDEGPGRRDAHPREKENKREPARREAPRHEPSPRETPRSEPDSPRPGC